MKTKFLKSLKVIALLALMVVIFSSCHRGGYGCPYEMTLGFLSFGIFK